jgi:hypothetical protein
MRSRWEKVLDRAERETGATTATRPAQNADFRPSTGQHAH